MKVFGSFCFFCASVLSLWLAIASAHAEYQIVSRIHVGGDT